jgi:hypothetical protein
VLGGSERGAKCGIAGTDDDHVAGRRKHFDNP